MGRCTAQGAGGRRIQHRILICHDMCDRQAIAFAGRRFFSPFQLTVSPDELGTSDPASPAQGCH